MPMVYFLLLLCLVGIVYLALGFFAVHDMVTATDKNPRVFSFKDVVACGAIGLVVLGIGVAGLLRLYGYSPSSVSAVVICLIAFPAFFVALFGLVTWMDATQVEGLADEKDGAIAVTVLGTVLCLIASLFAYFNK